MINGIIQSIANNSRFIDANITLYTRLGTAGIRTIKDDNKVERFVLEPVSVLITYALAITGATMATATFLHKRFLNQKIDQFGDNFKKLVAENLAEKKNFFPIHNQLPEPIEKNIDKFIRDSKGFHNNSKKGILKLKLVKDVDDKIITLTNSLKDYHLQYDQKIIKALNDFRYMINLNKYVAFGIGSLFSAFIGGFAMPVIYETIIVPYILPPIKHLLGKDKEGKH